MISLWDEITLYYNEADLAQAQKKQNSHHKITKKLQTDRIIHEDKYLIAYDKPAGLVVHPTDHKTDEVSLIEQIHDYLSDTRSESLTFAPALAHRIDRETSGIILIAKTKKTLEDLTEQFRRRTVNKEYLALVHGAPNPKSWDIEAPLHRSDEDRKEKPKVLVDERKWLKAKTSYQVISNFEHWALNFSLVSCHPTSGRMHQIRVHMTHIWHPIIWDRRYGKPLLRQNDKLMLRYVYRSDTPPRGHLLHAHKITFDHPDGNRTTFESRWQLLKNLEVD